MTYTKKKPFKNLSLSLNFIFTSPTYVGLLVLHLLPLLNSWLIVEM